MRISENFNTSELEDFKVIIPNSKQRQYLNEIISEIKKAGYEFVGVIEAYGNCYIIKRNNKYYFLDDEGTNFKPELIKPYVGPLNQFNPDGSYNKNCHITNDSAPYWMNKNGKIIRLDNSKQLTEICDYTSLFEDALNESLTFKNKRRWKLILGSLKFVNTDSYRKAFPDQTQLSDKEIIERLKQRLNNLSDEKKEELINSREVVSADIKLERASKLRKATAIPGAIIGGIGPGAGIAATYGTGALVAGGAGLAALGPIGWAILAAGGAALTAIGLGVVITGAAIASGKEKRLQAKKVTMKTENEIYNILKKEGV